MKKKIVQWLIGLLLTVYGLGVGTCLIGIVFNFISMINSTGKESVGYFIIFVFDLLVAVFCPYIFYKAIEDGVKDKFK